MDTDASQAFGVVLEIDTAAIPVGTVVWNFERWIPMKTRSLSK